LKRAAKLLEEDESASEQTDRYSAFPRKVNPTKEEKRNKKRNEEGNYGKL